MKRLFRDAFSEHSEFKRLEKERDERILHSVPISGPCSQVQPF